MQRNIDTITDIDDCIVEFEKIIINAKSTAIPTERNGSDGLFIDPHTRSLIIQRNYFRKIFLRNRNPIDNDIYKSLQKMVRRNIANLARERWETKLQNCESNNVEVFKLAKALKRKTTTIPTLDTVAVSDRDKAKILAERFNSNHINPLEKKQIRHTKMVERDVNNFLKLILISGASHYKFP